VYGDQYPATVKFTYLPVTPNQWWSMSINKNKLLLLHSSLLHTKTRTKDQYTPTVPK